MSKLDPRIEAVRKEYDLSADDFWQIPQNRQWVCKHSALEIVAVKAKIEWLAPQIIEADAPNLVTSMIVTGRMGDRVEWATGETNPTNYSVKGKQPAYPWAMSEKRAKDRVVLKLVGIHGLVYSEDEAEDFKPPATKPAPTVSRMGKEESRKFYSDLQRAILDAETLPSLVDIWRGFWPDIQRLPEDWEVEITNLKDQRKEALSEKEAA